MIWFAHNACVLVWVTPVACWLISRSYALPCQFTTVWFLRARAAAARTVVGWIICVGPFAVIILSYLSFCRWIVMVCRMPRLRSAVPIWFAHLQDGSIYVIYLLHALDRSLPLFSFPRCSFVNLFSFAFTVVVLLFLDHCIYYIVPLHFYILFVLCILLHVLYIYICVLIVLLLFDLCSCIVTSISGSI